MMVKELPKNVQDLFNNDQAVKVLATLSRNGMLHAVPLGSLRAPGPDTLVFANILAKETHANLEETLKKDGYVTALAVKGGESYQVRCKAKAYVTSGPAYDSMNEALKARGMKAAGVWLLTPVEVLNQSPGPNAGKPM
ncbi:MAG: pyridoxamine 5'-phosphate oxidase family protein [Betaproteobacteria bacterium]